MQEHGLSRNVRGEAVRRTNGRRGLRANVHKVLQNDAHLSLEDACARYSLTVEEFLGWQRSIDKHGLAGLRTTRLQQYR